MKLDPFLHLHNLCAELGLDVEVEERLFAIARQLAAWKAETQAGMTTPAVQRKAMSQVEDLAAALEGTLAGLSGPARIWLEHHYFNATGRSLLGSTATDDLRLSMPADAAFLAHVREAAAMVRAETPPGDGRPAVGEMQRVYLAFIAAAVAPASITPTTGKGAFHQVADTVFALAGLPLPQRALRSFVSTHKKG